MNKYASRGDRMSLIVNLLSHLKFPLGCALMAFVLSLGGHSCSPRPDDVRPCHEQPDIYPDYRKITIPYNIAPLHFLLRDEQVSALQVEVVGAQDKLTIRQRGRKVRFDLAKWRQLLEASRGDTLQVNVTVRTKEGWVSYLPLSWYVTPEPVDGYVTYRLIEPGYEVWNTLRLCERHLESFEERILMDNEQFGRRCMNCHIHGSNRGDRSMFHLRGKGGGTLLNREGVLRKLTLKAGPMISGAVYGDFHPNGRYGVFSTNIIIPAFHAEGSQRLEVYDTESDLVMADFDSNQLFASPFVSDSMQLETFPTFSPDGAWVYYCTAPRLPMPDSVKQTRYSLCRIAFHTDEGCWGTEVDTLWNARQQKGSVCHPKVSPDGRYLLYTVADYGTFPIWHRETELQLMNLQTMEIDTLAAVNSNRSETYHSWSSNSRWIAFASKRGDGQYGRIYLSYLDAEGRTHTPFVIPQSDPEMDDLNLKSYNIPDLSSTPVSFGADEVKALEEAPAETMEWVTKAKTND